MISNGLRSWVPSNVTLVRLHAMHFALLMPNCATKDIQQVAESLLRSIKTLRLNRAGKPLEIGASIGIALIRPQSENADSVLKTAENACQTAAAKGPNQIHMD